MSKERKNIIVTGMPRTGKTTLVENSISLVAEKQGFLTKEIRGKDNERVGFESITADGACAVIAHVNMPSPHKVGKYGVDVSAFDALLYGLFNFEEKDLLYIDEIGQMELFSALFRDLVLVYLNSPNQLIATLTSVYSDDFVKQIRQRNDIVVFELTTQNREIVGQEINRLFKRQD